MSAPMLDFTEVISCDLVAAHTSDLSVVNAARISFDAPEAQLEFPDGVPHDERDALAWGKLNERDAGLIDYLLRNRHGTPFEHGMFKFRVEAPIFAFREHHRHRVGHSYNEMSGRYTKLDPKFYVPRAARVQKGKPGHYVYVEQPESSLLTKHMQERMQHAYKVAWTQYERMLDMGIAKEQARCVLPVGIYTKMIWTCNPRSLMHFLGLRAEKSAQAEIRNVAEQAQAALAAHMPVTYASFEKNGRVAP